MARRYKRRRSNRRRGGLRASNAGPILALLGTVFGVLVTIALIVFVALPRLLPLVGVNYKAPWQPTPTPQPTLRPTPTQHPITLESPSQMQTEVVLPAEGYVGYRWFADPYVYGDELIFAAGRLIENDIHMDALLSYDMQARAVTKIDAKRENQDYVFPVHNSTWLVYLDGAAGGGGVIRAIERNTGNIKNVKNVYTGQPRLHLDGDHLAWIERTGSTMDKLFVANLSTLETVTVELFSKSPYGQSQISLHDNMLTYAYDDPAVDDGGISGIYTVSLKSGEKETLSPGTYVHNPMTNGEYHVWRDGLYGENNTLYFAKGTGTPRLLAEQVIDYGIGDTFVAYSKNNEPIQIYLFELEQSFPITPANDNTQLLGVSGGTVIWMDVTSRDSDIMKYIRVEGGLAR